MAVLDFALLSFTSLFVIMDPLGLIPAFLVMTRHNSVPEKIQTAKLACLTAFIILLLFTFGGYSIFHFLGITLPAFEIAGGLLLMIIALDMLQARRTAVKETPEEQAEGTKKEDIAITPLAIPMLAGPGAITAAILLNEKAATLQLKGVLVAIMALVCLICFLTLRLTAIRSSFISGIALKLTSRLMGLLLAAISVQFIINGIQKIF